MIYGDNDHGDMPVPQYALERELKEARREIKDLRTRLNEIKKGYEGCCHACEPVGAENCRLRELLNDTPEDILMRNQQLAIENESLRKERDAAYAEVSTLERNAEITYENHKRIVAELTAERDEARRSCCEFAAIVAGADDTAGMESGRFYEIAMNYMRDHGWDCYKENGK